MKKQLLFITLLIFLAPAAPAGASYAMKIDITGSSPDGYQAAIVIPWQSTMSSDFSDIRFYANATSFHGGTELPYWRENYRAGDSTYMWFPVPAGATKIYVEWGLLGETVSESDGKKVFPLLFDNFDNGALNDTLWTATNTGAYSISEQSGLLKLAATNGSITIRSKLNFTTPVVTEQNIYLGAAVMGNRNRFNVPMHTDHGIFDNANRIFFNDASTGIDAPSTDAIRLVTTFIPSNTCIWKVGNLYTGTSPQAYVMSGYVPGMRVGEGPGEFGKGAYNVDFIFARIYDATPVTVSLNYSVISSVSASFSANTTEGASPLGVQFTDASTGNVSSWLWNFGDGTTSTQQNPVHTFTTNETSKDSVYTVSLNVSDAEGAYNTMIRYNYIRVAADTNAAFSASQTITVVDDPIVFTDESTSSPVSWLWNFGDGTTSTAQNISHTYTANGNYTVSLKVTNSTGSFWTRTKTNYITIAAAPEVDFSAVPVAGYAPLTIQFTDLSRLGGASEWLWDFGDGNTSADQNPTHTYSIAGGYTVSLTVSNSAGKDTVTKASYIRVSYVNAAFTANKTVGTTSLDVQFTDESLGTPTSWNWDFGGGASPSSEQNPAVHFAVPGLYSVTLTASNAQGVDSITRYGYVRIADNGSATGMVITNVTDTWAYVPLNSSRDFTFSSNQAVALSYYQMNGGTVVNATNQSMAYTFTEPGYYVMEVWAANGNGQSNVIEFRTRVGRALASEHIAPLNDSAYYELENATLNMSTDAILTSLVQPFTSSIGRSFYLVLFVLPFIFLWFQQGKLTIPTTLALITGCIFVHYIPDTYTTFIGLAIVMSFAANFYKISRGPN